jgi:hypothetical protein
MDPQKQKTSAKDFFLNLGAIVALYTTVVALLNLLFTVINAAFPQITQYYYASSSSISFSTATLIIFFPIYILLSWLLEKSYDAEPEKKHLGVRRWLTYITLFVAGLTLAGDLVTVLYYFLDGQELTTGFLLKVLSVLVVAGLVFLYYISDVRKNLTTHEKRSWVVLSLLIILASIIWGFIVLGSPWTQQQIKYDQQKVSDLQNMNYLVQDFYQTQGSLPNSISDLGCVQSSNNPGTCMDKQTNKPYEYVLIGQSAKAYQLCATFNKDSQTTGVGMNPNYYYGPINASWDHPAGHYCFSETIPVSQYKPVPAVLVQ